jgi:uncharacterized protein with PIN domain
MVEVDDITSDTESSAVEDLTKDDNSPSDIVAPVVYTSAIITLTKTLLADPNFTHENWGDEILKDYRKYVRDYYRAAQSGLCAFCKQNISLVAAGNCHIEHIVPKSKYRKYIFEPKNLCVICADCNTIKRAKDVHPPEVLGSENPIKLYPRSSKAFLIVHPHFDKWEKHIVKFGSLYADLTEKGIFTMSACTLNRKLRIFGWEAVIASEADIRLACKEVSEAKDGIIMGRKLIALKRLLATT